MAEHPAVAVAETGVAELHHEPAFMGLTAPAFVALSMLVVIGIMLWQKVPALVGRMLDAKIDTIRTQLDEAAKLRAEAEDLLSKAKAQQAASAGDAAAIVAHAEAEAKALLADAERQATELTERRAKMAQDKIGAAERAAIAEVRARAASIATQVAGRIIAEQHGATADKPLIDRAISGLGLPN